MRVAEPAGPLADDELDALFALLADASLIALAVSGGADSLALLDTVDRWRRRRGGVPAAVVLSVDHRLRRGSAGEAANVVAIANARGLAARVLTWKGTRPKSDIEAAARRARYRLLIDATRAAGASHLLLAHHRDDQAETFLMRLQRGAGVFGLAAMRAEIALGDRGSGRGVTITRPFLALPRARLAATAAAAGLVPVEDAMNTDPRFMRARIRRIMPLLAADGFDPALLAAAAGRLAAAAQAIDGAATGLIGAAVTTDAFAIAWLDPGRFLAAPGEVRLRVLVRLLLAVGGEDYPPRFERLSGLLAAIEEHAGGSRFKRTLGGVIIEWRGGRFAFYRETGRVGLPSVAVGPGFDGQWDHRFAVAIGAGAPARLALGPLGEEGRRAVGARAAADLPAGALAALPALRRGRTIFAVPSLGYFAKGAGGLAVTVRALIGERLQTPPLFPDFAGGA